MACGDKCQLCNRGSLECLHREQLQTKCRQFSVLLIDVREWRNTINWFCNAFNMDWTSEHHCCLQMTSLVVWTEHKDNDCYCKDIWKYLKPFTLELKKQQHANEKDINYELIKFSRKFCPITTFSLWRYQEEHARGISVLCLRTKELEVFVKHKYYVIIQHQFSVFLIYGYNVDIPW